MVHPWDVSTRGRLGGGEKNDGGVVKTLLLLDGSITLILFILDSYSSV